MQTESILTSTMIEDLALPIYSDSEPATDVTSGNNFFSGGDRAINKCTRGSGIIEILLEVPRNTSEFILYVKYCNSQLKRSGGVAWLTPGRIQAAVDTGTESDPEM